MLTQVTIQHIIKTINKCGLYPQKSFSPMKVYKWPPPFPKVSESKGNQKIGQLQKYEFGFAKGWTLKSLQPVYTYLDRVAI